MKFMHAGVLFYTFFQSLPLQNMHSVPMITGSTACPPEAPDNRDASKFNNQCPDTEVLANRLENPGTGLDEAHASTTGGKKKKSSPHHGDPMNGITLPCKKTKAALARHNAHGPTGRAILVPPKKEFRTEDFQQQTTHLHQRDTHPGRSFPAWPQQETPNRDTPIMSKI